MLFAVMRIDSGTGKHQHRVSADISGGAARFERSTSTNARLTIEYRTPSLRADLAQTSIERVIDAICDHEIQRMRQTLGNLGDKLVSQLDDHGLTPVIDRTWESDEERTWGFRGDTFLVKPTTQKTVEELEGYEGASDAKLVQATVALVIRQREKSIRSLYKQILAEARGKRRAGTRPARNLE